MPVFVLVHSPVTGPSTWRWVAEELTAGGHRAIIPAVSPPITSAVAFAAVVAAGVPAEGDGQPVLVGHSGAGPVLPLIAARVAAGRKASPWLVFVDADVPPDAGQARLMPDAYLDPLRALAVDGILPKWSTWFGPEAMRELVPDGARRAIVSAELPQLPLSYFEKSVPVPAGWANEGAGYVLLSEAYEESAAAAAARGWPVERLEGAHLDLVTRPTEVAAAILRVAGPATQADGADANPAP
jgi:Alpha/beta hydrolase family